MPRIRIPRSAVSRRTKTWALLIRRVSPRWSSGIRPFDGTLLATGSSVELADLRPPGFPLIPLLIEYAGPTGRDSGGRAARGHSRSTDLHCLWRFDAKSGEFHKIASVLSEGPEWILHLAPLVRRELLLPPVNHAAAARAAVVRMFEVIDFELDHLEPEGRRRAKSFMFDQMASRMSEDLDEKPTAVPVRKPAGRELRRGAGARTGTE